MSLTSYQAAPPRDISDVICNNRPSESQVALKENERKINF